MGGATAAADGGISGVKATGVLDLRGSYENENDSKTDPTFLLFTGNTAVVAGTNTTLTRGSAAVDWRPIAGHCQADRGCDDRQQRASNTEALQQAAGEQGAAGDAQYRRQRAGTGHHQALGCGVIQQLADQAKELGIEIDLNYSFVQPKEPKE
jgi:hypothetical protein